jgi:phytoene dehydrogenase-like protein
MEDKSLIIIGAGFAGLSAGIYGRMNGYATRIFEMHTQPGGLCTAWKRKGYTVDGCIHWLVGSSPRSSFYRYWQEVGIAGGLKIVDLDEFARFEGEDGRTFVMHSDVDKLERHMLELSPRDEAATRRFISGVRLGLAFNPPSESAPPLRRLGMGLKFMLTMLAKAPAVRKWMKITISDLAARFQDPLIRDSLNDFWFPEFSALFMLFTLAYLHNRDAGYPVGGSMPMSLALAERYRGLGGEIRCGSRVEKILVEDGRAAGVRLADGSEHRAGRVISAADGHATIFDMLDGRFVDDKIREAYETWPPFPPLVYVGVGVNRDFSDVPRTVSGVAWRLNPPREIAGEKRRWLPAHIFNQDPTLAPPGKTVLNVMLPTSYEYWKDLGRDRGAYDLKKEEIARTIVELLDQRFPGLAGQVEMTDVATPLTFERYTGNWRGSFEGWQLTPRNAHTMIRPMSQTLPGLKNFHMCGQWVHPGGGLPTGVMSARRALRMICKEDGIKFRAEPA